MFFGGNFKMKTHNFFNFLLVLVVSAQIYHPHMAFAEVEDPYFEIQSVSIKEVSAEEAKILELNENDYSSVEKRFTQPSPGVPGFPPGPPFNGSFEPEIIATNGEGPIASNRGMLDSVIMIVDKLIAIGQKIIPNIKNGAPVVTNNSMASVSVLPRSENKDQVVHDMSDWSIPVSKHYKIVFGNGFGSDVVSFIYSISFQYNGNVHGKGKYLTGIRASARNITIAWGYDIDASSQLIQISNVGTPENVIAGATLEMTYTVKNWSKNITTSKGFFVTGDGKLYKLD
jgi:hypothetical protein